MSRSDVADGAIRIATYNRDHQVVINRDGTIEIYRRPSTTGDTAFERSRAALETINRRNAEFWKEREGIPGQ